MNIVSLDSIPSELTSSNRFISLERVYNLGFASFVKYIDN